jgi:hypothetical protein
MSIEELMEWSKTRLNLMYLKSITCFDESNMKEVERRLFKEEQKFIKGERLNQKEKVSYSEA